MNKLYKNFLLLVLIISPLPLYSAPEGFADLVPGLSEIASRRGRRLRASQVDPENEEAVTEMMELSEDEEVSWEEE